MRGVIGVGDLLDFMSLRRIAGVYRVSSKRSAGYVSIVEIDFEDMY